MAGGGDERSSEKVCSSKKASSLEVTPAAMSSDAFSMKVASRCGCGIHSCSASTQSTTLAPVETRKSRRCVARSRPRSGNITSYAPCTTTSVPLHSAPTELTPGCFLSVARLLPRATSAAAAGMSSHDQ